MTCNVLNGMLSPIGLLYHTWIAEWTAVLRLQVKVMKPQVEKQVHDEVSNVVIHRSHNRDSLPKLSVDSTDVSLYFAVYSSIKVSTL